MPPLTLTTSIPETRSAQRPSPSLHGTLRVLMVVESSGGGTGRHVLDLCEGLAARGCEVHLIYSTARADRLFLDRIDRLSAPTDSGGRRVGAGMTPHPRPLSRKGTGESDPARPRAFRSPLPLRERVRVRGHSDPDPTLPEPLGAPDRIGSVRLTIIEMRTGIHPADLAVTLAVRRYLRRHGPFDAVHGHSSKGGAIARLAALGTGAPAFYTLHGFIVMDPGMPRWKRLFYLAIECALSRVTARVIAVSPEEGRAATRLGLGRSRVVVVPNGIAPAALLPRAEARAALGVVGDAPVIGFVGRLVDQKAPDVLLRAFATVARVAPGANLAMVGSGPLAAPMRRLADDLGVGDRVLWLGERDARGVLAAFDVFALASRKEGLPYVVLEAMIAGLPVVATSTAGVEILVTTGVNGSVVPEGDAPAFAAALIDLATDPARRARFGLASRERAARFSIDAMVDRTLSAYLGDLPTTRPTAISHQPSAISHPPTPNTSETHHHHRGGPTVPSTSTKPRSAELHPGPGFRVRAGFTRPDPSLSDAFRAFATPDISDLLNRLYAVDPVIRCLTNPAHTLCGPACTVKVFPGDNLMVHKALDVARPGDVIVVDAGGATTNAVLGDLISAKARHRGIAGFVVDGLIRDLPSIVDLDFPVFARGTTPIGPLHRGPGEINYAVCCGGIVVNPGDLVVADAAGVIVVPREIAPELLRRLMQHQESNRLYSESVRRGEFSNQWVDRVLEEHLCPVLGLPEPRPVRPRVAAEVYGQS